MPQSKNHRCSTAPLKIKSRAYTYVNCTFWLPSPPFRYTRCHTFLHTFIKKKNKKKLRVVCAFKSNVKINVKQLIVLNYNQRYNTYINIYIHAFRNPNHTFTHIESGGFQIYKQQLTSKYFSYVQTIIRIFINLYANPQVSNMNKFIIMIRMVKWRESVDKSRISPAKYTIQFFSK